MSVLRHCWALMLGMFMISAAHGLSTTLIGMRGAQLGFGDLQLGLIMSGFFAGFLAGAAVAPALIRRVGHVRVFAFFASAASATLILFPLLENALAWFVLRLLTGACMAGSYVVAEAWLNGLSGNAQRGRVLALYLFVQLFGMVAGQGLLAAGNPVGYPLFVIATTLVSLAIGPLLVSAAPVPVHAGVEAMSFRTLYRASPLAFVGMIFMGLLYSIMLAMSPVYGVSIGLSAVEIAALVAAMNIGGTLLLHPAGWLSDRIGRRPVVIGLSLAGAVLALAAGLSGAGGWMLVGLAGVMAAAISPLYSILAAHANDRMDADRLAACSARLIILQGMGAAVGPPAVGALMSTLGAAAFFPLIALLALALGGFAAWRVRRREAETVEEQVGFTPMPVRGTTVAAEIYAEAVQEEGAE